MYKSVWRLGTRLKVKLGTKMKNLNIPHDKLLHFLVSALLLMYLAQFMTLVGATIVALAIGGVKEYFWDYLLKKGTPDWHDMFANILGVIISLIVIALGGLI
jgi:ABC-type transporter Mla maintaining outer membrane lipid asymmetry permease subunit MlaE